MTRSQDRYISLLDDDRDENGGYHFSSGKKRWLSDGGVKVGMLLSLLLSVGYNLFQAHEIQKWIAKPDHCRSNYTGLAYDTPMNYETNWGRNESEADDYWNLLDASPVVVALGHEEASRYGLGPSVQFPWDDEKNLYYIKAFHHIHCLKIIRKAFKSYERTKHYDGDHEHIYHCINTLRQDIMCKPDDTLMTSVDEPHVIGDNQHVQCRDWNKLVAWSQDPQRHSCYHIFEDDRHVVNTLESYAFCPEDSPHYQTMKAYFERHGHKNVFDDSVEATGYRSSRR
jgi:hypothetical protein